MEKSERTREKIVAQTIALIQENGGDSGKVTIRGIAERSGISVGLIHHYFESKNVLIESCVQRIIGGVIRSFSPDIAEGASRTEKLKRVTKQVMDFLMENQQVSRISILGDMTSPKATDNTMNSVRGFAGTISQGKPTQEDMQKAFMLAAMLQGAFLRKDVLNEALGIDLYRKDERDCYIDTMIEQLMGDGEE